MDNEAEKKCCGRPKIYEEGYKEHYKTSKYMLNYYHTNKELIPCPLCNKNTKKAHIREHQKSKKCKRLALLNKVIE